MEVIDLPPNHVLEQGTRKKLFFGSIFILNKNKFIYLFI
jgi:hypothetical protein